MKSAIRDRKSEREREKERKRKRKRRRERGRGGGRGREHKLSCAQTTFYILLHQLALHNPYFGPVGQRPKGRRNSENYLLIF